MPTTFEPHPARTEQLSNRTIYHFPLGLPGLPELKQCELIFNEEAYPLLWLQSVDGERVRLPVAEPGPLVENYQIELSDDDAEFLDLQAEGARPLVLAVLTVKSMDPQKVTLNLLAPIVINQATSLGKQVILENYGRYSVEHPVIDETQGTPSC
jgi:flagellar assembly factor FliW